MKKHDNEGGEYNGYNDNVSEYNDNNNNAYDTSKCDNNNNDSSNHHKNGVNNNRGSRQQQGARDTTRLEPLGMFLFYFNAFLLLLTNFFLPRNVLTNKKHTTHHRPLTISTPQPAVYTPSTGTAVPPSLA
jgi:hypothetical protein